MLPTYEFLLNFSKQIIYRISLFFFYLFQGDEKPRGKNKEPYSCPCYKIPRRTDLNYIFNMKLNSREPAKHWVMRGVALLCSVDR